MHIFIQAKRVFALLAALFPALLHTAAQAPSGGLERFYVGTYSGKIYLATLDLSSASFGVITQAVSTVDPSFIALSANRAFLYSVNEGPGTVSAFSVNPTNGTLKFLNQKSSNGGAPAHIVLDRGGQYALVANYNGGSVTVFPLQADGKLGNATSHIQHPGSSPHAHCVTLDAGNHFAFVCDKGLDQIRSYVFDPSAGTLTTNLALITPVAKGSGPRHMVFAPDFTRAYVICELSSTVIGFNYDSTSGVLSPFQTVSTLPSAGISGNTTAEVAVHPSGRFLYGSNRGHNTIAVYTIHPETGVLAPVQYQTTGAIPRHFAIDPTGAFCLVAGQNSNDIRLYTIEPATGLLTDTGRKLAASSPVCLLPFLVIPPPPTLALSPGADDTISLQLGNTFQELTYQVYHSAGLSSDARWELLTTGQRGQTNFVLTNIWFREFFQAAASTNF